MASATLHPFLISQEKFSSDVIDSVLKRLVSFVPWYRYFTSLMLFGTARQYFFLNFQSMVISFYLLYNVFLKVQVNHDCRETVLCRLGDGLASFGSRYVIFISPSR